MAERNVVTVGQIFTLLLISRLSVTVIYSVFVTGIESLWSLIIPLLLSMAALMGLLVPVNLLYGKGRKQSVCGIAVERWGTVGLIISLMYGIYFLGSCIYAVMSLQYFLEVLLPEGIPAKAVLAVLVGACIYAALKGIEALSRMSAIVLGLIVLSGVLLVIYLMPGFSSDNLIPSEYMTMGSVTDGIVLILSRMNTAAALNVLLPLSKGRVWKSSLLWTAGLFLIMILMIVLFRGALGDYSDTRELPVYQSIEGAGSLQRLNPFFIFVSMCSVFCNVSVLLFSVSESVKAVFRNSFGKTITVISGVILLGVVLWLPKTEMIFHKEMWCILGVLFTFGIPLGVYAAERAQRKHSPKVRKVIRTATMTIILSVVMLSGCNSMQLNERLIVQGLGIDKEKDGYEMTLIVLDTENEDKENAVKLMYTDGATVSEALSTLENQRGKKLLLSQCLFIMMDRETVKNYDKALSYFGNLKEMQKTANLMSTDGSAKKTIFEGIENLGYHSENINVLADSRAVEQTEVHCSLSDYISCQKSKERAMIFPNVIVRKDIQALSVSGSNVSDGNGNIYSMTKEETIGTLLVNQKVTDFTDTVAMQGKESSYRIEGVKSRVIPKWKNSYLDVSFEIEVNLDKKYGQEITRLIEENIKEKIDTAIGKTLFENGSDIFSLEKHIKNVYPERYRETDIKELLQNAVTHTKVTCV